MKFASGSEEKRRYCWATCCDPYTLWKVGAASFGQRFDPATIANSSPGLSPPLARYSGS
jgi:hypothetical protein